MRRQPDVLWRAAPGYLVLGKTDGTVIAISGAAAEAWELLADDVSWDAIVDSLAARYGAERTQVQRDLDALFTTLVDGGYVSDA